MRALLLTEFSGRLDPVAVDVPSCPPHAAVIAVRATGVCRSDHHAWAGHDPDVALPHVPGHEFSGVVAHVGAAVAHHRAGERVTAPFVNACGACPSCAEGRGSTCLQQTQPGFDRWGSWAEFVVVHHADVNLVTLPDAVDDVTAAGLGCRFATAYRGLVTLGRVAADEVVAVYGCGGVGQAAIHIAAAHGAHVVAVDPSPAARELAAELGATHVLPDPDAAADCLTGLGGAHLGVDALGRASLVAASLAALRPGGRHVQIGLLVGADRRPRFDLGRVIARELTLHGAHGMSAAEYPAMLAEIAAGRLRPQRLVGRTLPLDGAGDVLARMGRADQPAGTSILIP